MLCNAILKGNLSVTDSSRRVIALATKGVPVEGCDTTPLDLRDDTQRRTALQESMSHFFSVLSSWTWTYFFSTLQLLVHSADLSNLCKRWEIHIQWSHAILAEFFSQVHFERTCSENQDFNTHIGSFFQIFIIIMLTGAGRLREASRAARLRDWCP